MRISTKINNEYIVFFLSFAFLTLLATPTVNTGDSGELITSAYFLGIAHPSGYPLYLILAKAFSLIPFGNIAFRVSLLSVLSSSVSLLIVYRIILRITDNKIAGFFSVVFLIGSYSFVTQSVITKFYPLNLMLICFVTLLCVEIFLDAQSFTRAYNKNTGEIIRKKVILISLLIGVITASHHTGLIILGPIILMVIFKPHSIFPENLLLNPVKTIIEVVLAFIVGFSINIYLFLRGGDEPFSNVFHIYSFKDFFMHISRGVYGSESTLTLATNLTSDFTSSILYGFNHFIEAIVNNFGVASLILFSFGSIYLFRKNKNIFIFTMLALLFYGPLLAKLRLPQENVSDINYYIVIHQYFMPALWFYAFFLGNGVASIIIFIREKTSLNLNAVLISFCLIFAFLFALQRLNDSNYRTNYIAYQSAKDALSILPENSLYFSIGDNEKFVSRYLALIGQYRNDVCQLNGVILQNKVSGLSGCREYSFGTISPEKMKTEWEQFLTAAKNGRLYTDSVPYNKFPIVSTMNAYHFGPLLSWRLASGEINEAYNSADMRLLSPFICYENRTVDIFSDYLCTKNGYKSKIKLK